MTYVPMQPPILSLTANRATQGPAPWRGMPLKRHETPVGRAEQRPPSLPGVVPSPDSIGFGTRDKVRCGSPVVSPRRFRPPIGRRQGGSHDPARSHEAANH
jgi:hypothetical protein